MHRRDLLKRGIGLGVGMALAPLGAGVAFVVFDAHRADDRGAVAAPPEVVLAFQRAPSRTMDVLRQMLACAEAHCAVAAPMHHERGHADPVQIGTQIGVAQATENRFEPSR